jgi:hypothetical protein
MRPEISAEMSDEEIYPKSYQKTSLYKQANLYGAGRAFI